MKIAVIGNGNVATHLYKALKESKSKVEIINSRTLDGLSDEFDIIMICVSDRAITETAGRISKKLPGYKGVAVHTAGSVGIDILKPFFRNYGVFYPLQTFNKEIEIKDYGEIPIFFEGSSDKVEALLSALGSSVFRKAHRLSSQGREKLHLASVFACNFVNAMYSMADQMLKTEALPFDVLRSLIRQTTEKIMTHTPSGCQTGPASRGDYTTLERHARLLQSDKELETIYKIISDYIIKHHASARK